MTATATEDETGTEAVDSGFKPRYIALIVGGVFALVTAASYLAEQLWAEDWNREEKVTHPVSREYFFNIPGALRLTFYIVMVIVILYGAWTFSNRMRNWE